MSPTSGHGVKVEIDQLYRTHGIVVLRRARMLLGNEADAQEALQEIFAALLRDPQSIREAQSAVAWLYQATTHHCLNVLRNRRTSARLLDSQVAPRSQEHSASSAETLFLVRSLLSQLAPDAAQAVVYTHLDGLTHAETAALLSVSPRQVRYLLERAQESLARAEQLA